MIPFGLIPAPYGLIVKIGVAVLLAAGLIAAGDHMRGARDDAKYTKIITDIKSAYQARVDEAQKAKDAANERTRIAEAKLATDLALADKKHIKEITDEKARTQAAVDDAAAGRRKLQFYAAVAANTGSGSQLPNAVASSGSSDGRALVQLPAAIGANLYALTGEVDAELVPQIHLLQDTVNAYYTACGPKGTQMTLAPAEGGPSPIHGLIGQPSATIQ